MTPDVATGTLRRFRVELLVIAAAVLLVTGLAVQHAWYGVLDRMVFDTVARLAPLDTDERILLVGIDSRSLSRIGRWPWPRETQARLLDAIRSHHPKSIFVDVVYSEAGPAEGDRQLVASAAQIDALFLPVVIDAVTPGGALLEQLPFPDLLDVTDALGHVHVAPDGDGIVRGSFLYEGIGEPHWPHVGVALSGTPGVREAVGCPETGASSIANERCGYRRIRFAGPPGSFPHISAHEVLDGALDGETFRDRIVLVGRTDLGAPDAVPVPVSADIRPMAGVEYNANLLNAMLRGGVLSPVAPWVTWALTLGWVMLALWLVPRLLPGQMLSVSIVLALIPVAFSAIALVAASRFVDLAAASVGAALVYPLWSWRRNAMGWRFVGEELDRLAIEAFRWSRRRARMSGSTVDERLEWLFPARDPANDAALRLAQPESEALRDAIVRDQRQVSELPGHPADPFVSRLLRIQTLADEVRAGREVSMAGIEQMPVGLCIFVASGNVLLSNASFRTFTGTAEEHSYFVEKSLAGLEGVDWRPVLRRAALREETQTVETRNTAGQRLIARFEPLRVSGYAQPVCLLTLNDVTAIRLAQERRDETLAFVSHDLRSPISSILSIVRNPRLADDPQALQRIENYARRSLNVSEEFVRLSRLENLAVLERDDVDLLAVIENAIDQSFELARDRTMHVVFERDEITQPLLWIPGNGEMLERVFVNLIDNAIKYSPAGSQVTIGLRVVDGAVEVDVRDEGYGIAASDVGRVFDPYFRAMRTQRSASSGVGLGLRFVRTAIELHGGSVRVVSEEGQGSTFIVRLPAE